MIRNPLLFPGRIFMAYVLFPALLSVANPTNPISLAEKDQGKPVASSRSSGSGAIFAWEDNRSGNGDIYAQLLCGCDSASWKTDGLPVCAANGEQRNPVIISDTSDGAIIAWEDNRNGTVNIYAQRVDRHGAMLWAENGVALAASAFHQKNPAIAADSAGGAIIVWEEERNNSDSSDIFAQRISMDGELQWDSGGAVVCNQNGPQVQPRLICNRKGGALITWQDRRLGDNDIYSQSLDSSGSAKWGIQGVAITTAAMEQSRPRLVGDGLGGAIIAWNDFRSATDWDIFAQRIDAAGSVKWAPDGVVMNDKQPGDQVDPVIEIDGQGGAIVVWTDKRSGNDGIQGQRVAASGTVQWASTGVWICAVPGDQGDPQIVRLYRGGAAVAWVDSRNDASSIRSQVINADGVSLFSDEGMVISAADGDQINPEIVTDGDEGFITIWQDSRNADFDLYSRIIPGQSIPVGMKSISRVPARSGRGSIHVSQTGEIRYDVEQAGNVSLEILELSGRRLATLVNGFRTPGAYSIGTIGTNGTAGDGSRLRGGIYLCRLKTGGFESFSKISILP